MKNRVLALTLIVAAVWSFCACGSDQNVLAENRLQTRIEGICLSYNLRSPSVSVTKQDRYEGTSLSSYKTDITVSGFALLSDTEKVSFFQSVNRAGDIGEIIGISDITVYSSSYKYTYQYEIEILGEKEAILRDGEVYYLVEEDQMITPKTNTSSGENISAASEKPKGMFEEYLEENNVTLDAKDVQYDQINNQNTPFSLVGKAKLSDYYNYGYDAVEKTHFCLQVTPTGGGYTDSWYIYCGRNSFQSVYDKALSNGTISVKMVCEISKYQKNQSRMAELVYIVY